MEFMLQLWDKDLSVGGKDTNNIPIMQYIKSKFHNTSKAERSSEYLLEMFAKNI